MIQAASALVRDVTSGKAAIAAALMRAKLGVGSGETVAVVFGTPHYRADAGNILAACLESGCTAVYGGSAAGVMTEEGEVEGGPGLALLLFRGVTTRPISVTTGEELRGTLQAGDTPIVFPDPATVDLAEMVRTFDANPPFFPLLGGALSGGTESTGHYQFSGAATETRRICGFSLSGISTVTGVAHGCRPIGTPLVITRSNGHLVLSLAGRPPLEILRETLDRHAKAGGKGGPVMAGIAMDASRSPLRRGDFIVRNLIAVKSPEGELLAVGTPVRMGQTLVFQLMERAAAEEDMKEMVAEVKQELNEVPAFGLYFNCRGRGKQLFGATDHDALEIRSALGTFPLIGFSGNAEFAPVGGKNWMHNYTGALLTVRQAAAAAE